MPRVAGSFASAYGYHEDVVVAGKYGYVANDDAGLLRASGQSGMRPDLGWKPRGDGTGFQFSGSPFDAERRTPRPFELPVDGCRPAGVDTPRLWKSIRLLLRAQMAKFASCFPLFMSRRSSQVQLHYLQMIGREKWQPKTF